MPSNIYFNRKRRDALREAYEAAVVAKLDRFEFEDRMYLVSYARYLLEYLDNVLG